jgi:hypothetical protein
MVILCTINYISLRLFFFIIAPNDRGYGHWRSAGVFPVVKRQKEMRAQRLLNARQPANEHRRVLGARPFLFQSVVLVCL